MLQLFNIRRREIQCDLLVAVHVKQHSNIFLGIPGPHHCIFASLFSQDNNNSFHRKENQIQADTVCRTTLKVKYCNVPMINEGSENVEALIFNVPCTSSL